MYATLVHTLINLIITYIIIICIKHNTFRETNTVYNFHGCWWHGCLKCKTKDRDDTSKGWSLNKKFTHTEKISQYIRDFGYNLIEIWECEYNIFKRTNTITNRYLYPTENKYRLSEKEILDGIKENKIFGAIEVDLHVPDHLKSYFAELTPIFKHATVNFADIGQHMQNFVNESGMTFKKRYYLIGSMFATKILLITPLLQWYIDHGIVVSRIHQLIQFSPSKCFEQFADSVSNDRRGGDVNPDLKVVADTSKLIGL